MSFGAQEPKLLIIHADDAGLSNSQNRAIIESLKNGLVNSYSIMTPCPCFDEIGDFAKSNPQYDYGIHLTLTCEWESYKFGPVSPIESVRSLVNEDGYFYKTRNELKAFADIKEIKKELNAQIQKAFDYGLNPTHIDSHMYSVGINTECFNLYKELEKVYKIPILINDELLKMVGLDPKRNIKENDFVIENMCLGNYSQFSNDKLKSYYLDFIQNITGGLSIILIHPAYDDNEMKSITINHPNFGSKWRQIDFDVFNDKRMISEIKKNEIQLISWRDLY
tara:strand:+ start:1134 stop:1970 length:837 start_codon:yes stop_codon:yes gene_type:complete